MSRDVKLLSANPSPNDLIPLSKTELLGIGIGRRVISRRIAAGEFPTPIRLKGRLYITHAQLQAYKDCLMRGDGHKHWAEKSKAHPPAAAETAE